MTPPVNKDLIIVCLAGHKYSPNIPPVTPGPTMQVITDGVVTDGGAAPTQSPDGPPNPCTAKIDAIAIIRQELMIFSGKVTICYNIQTLMKGRKACTGVKIVISN